MELRFAKSESTFDYFEGTRSYLERQGKPVAFYSDQASIFRVTDSHVRQNGGLTQFGRALSELNIDIICANTPQAKGRVERAHLTLQDRLVKELRVADIATIEAANAFAPAFLDDYNARFGKDPLSDHDAHRAVREDEDLALIFSRQEERRISTELTVHFQRGRCLIEPSAETLELRGRRCRVHEYFDGRIEFRYEGRCLPFVAFEEQRRVSRGDIVANKRLGAVLAQIKADQRARDEQELASPRTKRRRKEQIRAVRTKADAPAATP
jgi:hypothetical protein